MTTPNANVPATITAAGLLADLPIPPKGTYELPPLSFLYGYWRGGKKELAPLGLSNPLYVGGFSFSAEKLQAAPLSFTSLKLSGAEGEFVEWSTPVIEVAVIAEITSYFDPKTKQHYPKFDLQHVKDRRQKTELLCFVRDIDGPVVLSAKGHNARNLHNAYSQGYQSMVRALKSPQQFPPFTFYMPLGGEVDSKGQPVFRAVGKEVQNNIVPIKFRAGENLTLEWLAKQRVEPAVFQNCLTALPTVEAWRAARFGAGRDTLQDAPPDDGGGDISEDDVPFE